MQPKFNAYFSAKNALLYFKKCRIKRLIFGNRKALFFLILGYKSLIYKKTIWQPFAGNKRGVAY
jgi:hypothetical protein